MFEQFQSKSGFENVDPDLSSALFKELTSGKLVNREKWDVIQNDFVDNKLYNCLFNNMEHFKTFYQHMGFELVFNEKSNFFYLRKYSDNDDKDYNRNAFKIQVTLLILGRYFAQSGRDLKWLASPSVGIQADDIKAIKDNEEYLTMFRAAEFKDGPQLAIAFLQDRGFLFETGKDRYIMSPAGMHFINSLIQNYEASYSDTLDSGLGETETATPTLAESSDLEEPVEEEQVSDGKAELMDTLSSVGE